MCVAEPTLLVMWLQRNRETLVNLRLPVGGVHERVVIATGFFVIAFAGFFSDTNEGKKRSELPGLHFREQYAKWKAYAVLPYS